MLFSTASAALVALPICAVLLVLILWAKSRQGASGPTAGDSLDDLVAEAYRLYLRYQSLDRRYSRMSQQFHSPTGVFAGAQRLLAFSRYELDGLSDADAVLVFEGLVRNGLLPPLAGSDDHGFAMSLDRYRDNLALEADAAGAKLRLESAMEDRRRDIGNLTKNPLNQRLEILHNSLLTLAHTAVNTVPSRESIKETCTGLEQILTRNGYTVRYPGDATAPDCRHCFVPGAGPLPAILWNGEPVCMGREG